MKKQLPNTCVTSSMEYIKMELLVSIKLKNLFQTSSIQQPFQITKQS